MKKILSLLLIFGLLITGGVLANTIKVRVNGGELQISATEGNGVIVQSKVPDINGWSATGITLTDEQQHSTLVDFTMPNNLVELEATVKSSLITYDANGGSGAPASQIKLLGLPIVLSSLQPVLAGRTFIEWNTAQNGSGTRYMPGDTYSLDADLTLYAQWSGAVTFTWDTTGQLSKSIIVKTTGATTINWGDGTVENVASSPSSVLNLSHTYVSAGNYTVRIMDNVVTELLCDNIKISALDITRATALQYLSCEGNNLNSLDVTNSTALRELWCGVNNLNSLDVSNNTALVELGCYSNSLTSLDVSNNTALVKLYCSSNNLTSLNINNNTNLQELRCDDNSLTSLNVSHNLSLTSLYCRQSSLGILVTDSRQSMSIDKRGNTHIVEIAQTVNGTISYDTGYSFNITPDPGKVIITLTAGGVSQTPATTYDFVSLSGDTTLTATFGVVYTVTYDANGGSDAPQPQSKIQDVALTLRSEIPTKSGDRFTGWNTAQDGSGTWYLAGGSYTANANVTLYAQWVQQVTLEVWINTNGSISTAGGSVTGTGTYDIGSTVILTAIPNSGYEFSNWNTQGDGTGENVWINTLQIQLTENRIVSVAFWQQYTVTYDANYGSGAPAAQTKTHGVPLTLSSTIPTRNGYRFNGWNTAQDGSGTPYAAGGSYTANANVTLYAQWVQQFTVTLDDIWTNWEVSSAGGYVTGVVTGTYDIGTPITLTAIPNAGYIFEGFYVYQGEWLPTVRVNPYTFYVSGDVTLRPHFLPAGAINFTWDATGQLSKSIQVLPFDDMIIDWGDGVIDNVSYNAPITMTLYHTYTSGGVYLVRIMDNVVNALVLDNQQVVNLDITNATNLSGLACNYNQLASLDVSHNLSLTYLAYINGTPASSLPILILDARQSLIEEQNLLVDNCFIVTIDQTANGTISYAGGYTFNITPNPGYTVQSLTVGGVPQTPATTYTFNSIPPAAQGYTTHWSTITATFVAN